MNYESRIMGIGLIAALVGYLTQNLLGFDTTVPGMYLIFLLAYAHSIISQNEVMRTPLSLIRRGIGGEVVKTGIFVALLMLFILSFKMHMDILKANHQLNLSEALAHSGQIEQGFAAFEKGLEYNAKPINPNLRRRYAIIALAYYDAVEKSCAEKNPLLAKEGSSDRSRRGVVDPAKCVWLHGDAKNKLARALELQQENAAKEWPHFTRNYIYAAQIAHILGDFESSNKYFAKALELSPGRKSINTKLEMLRLENSSSQ